MADPIDYGSPLRSGILTGLQGGTMLQGIGIRNRQIQQEDQQQQAMQQFQQDWQQAYSSGDPKQLDALVAKYPGQMETIQKAIGFRDDNHRMALGNAARDLRIALASKQPGAVRQAAQSHADTLESIGSSPDDVLQSLQNDPQGLRQLVDTVGMGALGVKDYYDTENRRDQIAETQRSNRAGEALQSRGQDIQVRGQNISASNSAAGREVQLQIHRDNMALSLQALSQKQLNSEKIDPKLVRDLNSDINGYSKNYSAMRGAADNLQALGKRNTPAAQLGMIFNYMKSLDPQSVVREGEQVQVKRTDGIYGTLGNYVSQLSSGKMLNDGQVSDLINTSKLMANTEGEKFNQQMNDYLSSYGDSLPQGLTNQLQSRKAKLYTDVPEAPNNAKGKAISGVNEGATATNPRTGQKLIFRGGQWQPI